MAPPKEEDFAALLKEFEGNDARRAARAARVGDVGQAIEVNSKKLIFRHF